MEEQIAYLQKMVHVLWWWVAFSALGHAYKAWQIGALEKRVRELESNQRKGSQ